MDASLSLIMFCTNANYSAGAPRKASANLNFSLPPKSDKVDDDNTAVFSDPNQRGANFNLSGVTRDLMAKFADAPRVKVTIEILPD